MTRQRRRFTPQQKAEAIALCQSEGPTILAASKRIGSHATCLGRSIRQAGIDAEGPTKNGPLSTSERDEMTRLKKENREMKKERDFFKLAAAHFAVARKASTCGRSRNRQKHQFMTSQSANFTICKLLNQLGGQQTGSFTQRILFLAASSRQPRSTWSGRRNHGQGH